MAITRSREFSWPYRLTTPPSHAQPRGIRQEGQAVSEVLYRVANWDRYESHCESRRAKGPLTWLPRPTDLSSRDHCRLMSQSDGLTLWALWELIVRIAARGNPRGTLVDASGIPHDVESLSYATHAPRELFHRFLPWFVEMKMLAETTSGPLTDGTVPREQTGAHVSSRAQTDANADTRARGDENRQEKKEERENPSPSSEGADRTGVQALID